MLNTIRTKSILSNLQKRNLLGNETAKSESYRVKTDVNPGGVLHQFVEWKEKNKYYFRLRILIEKLDVPFIVLALIEINFYGIIYVRMINELQF